MFLTLQNLEWVLSLLFLWLIFRFTLYQHNTECLGHQVISGVQFSPLSLVSLFIHYLPLFRCEELEGLALPPASLLLSEGNDWIFVSPLKSPCLCCPKIGNPSCWGLTDGRTVNPKIRSEVLKVHPKITTNNETPKRLQLHEQESHTWLNTPGQPTRESESPKSLGGSPGWLWAQADAGVDGCIHGLPLHVCTPRARPVWCRTNPTPRRCRERLLQNPHCMRCAFPVNTHSVYNAGAIKSDISPSAGKCANLKLGEAWWNPSPCSSPCTCLLAAGKNGFCELSKLWVREVDAKRLLEGSLWIKALCRSGQIWFLVPCCSKTSLRNNACVFSVSLRHSFLILNRANTNTFRQGWFLLI